MKLVFIGASHWHLSLYLDPAPEIAGVQVVGVSDPDASFVKALATRLGCVGDTDFHALCRKTRPDFVVALGRHCDMVEEATFLLEEAIPFALEKPCGLNTRDAVELAALEERTGNFAAVPLVFRNGDFIRDVLDRVRAGHLPLARLSDMVPIMRLVDEAYAKAAPWGRRRSPPAAG